MVLRKSRKKTTLNKYSKKNISIGKKCLAKALAEVSTWDGGEVPRYVVNTEAALGLAANLKVKNLESLVLHMDRNGLWTADLLFQNIPAGSPDIIGTPTANPLRTKKDAWNAALGIVAQVYHDERLERRPIINIPGYITLGDTVIKMVY